MGTVNVCRPHKNRGCNVVRHVKGVVVALFFHVYDDDLVKPKCKTSQEIEFQPSSELFSWERGPELSQARPIPRSSPEILDRKSVV